MPGMEGDAEQHVWYVRKWFARCRLPSLLMRWLRRDICEVPAFDRPKVSSQDRLLIDVLSRVDTQT
eukprot:10008642-Alexandrium_andersonii.AAC.1